MKCPECKKEIKDKHSVSWLGNDSKINILEYCESCHNSFINGHIVDFTLNGKSVMIDNPYYIVDNNS